MALDHRAPGAFAGNHMIDLDDNIQQKDRFKAEHLNRTHVSTELLVHITGNVLFGIQRMIYKHESDLVDIENKRVDKTFDESDGALQEEQPAAHDPVVGDSPPLVDTNDQLVDERPPDPPTQTAPSLDVDPDPGTSRPPVGDTDKPDPPVGSVDRPLVETPPVGSADHILADGPTNAPVGGSIGPDPCVVETQHVDSPDDPCVTPSQPRHVSMFYDPPKPDSPFNVVLSVQQKPKPFMNNQILYESIRLDTGRPKRILYLTKKQAEYLIMLMSNTASVLPLKKRIMLGENVFPDLIKD